MARLAYGVLALAAACSALVRTQLSMGSGSQVAYRIRRKRIANQDKGRMRLNVFRSNNNIYAQVIDDKAGHTLCSASTLDETLKDGKTNDQAAAAKVGALLAERAKGKGLEKVYFDRFSGSHKYLYHGRVKALVEGLREGGVTV
mmetsp:Transcript_10461/g.31225  ORF Transcript_10461/g.31225 Transcript_10461/m.31225 type:complete len:144 (+) Transcript_10461:111-542(+)